MTIDNEELIDQMQQVTSLMRRDRRVIAKGAHGHKAEGKGNHGHCDKHDHHGHDHGHDEREHEPHGIGNHKAHGGSGHHGQNRVLSALMIKDGISQKDLAYLLAIRPQSLSQAIDKLEERGLATRKQNDDDKRVINVYLTDDGRRCAEKVAENRREWANQIFEPLTDEEKEQLANIMDKLEANLKEQTAKFGRGHDDEEETEE